MSVVHLDLAPLLAARGLSWYQLAALSGISRTTIYKLKNSPGGRFDRLEARTIDALCRVLECAPGDFIRYTPAKRKGS